MKDSSDTWIEAEPEDGGWEETPCDNEPGNDFDETETERKTMTTTETVTGLLTQKASSPPPVVGQIKSLTWENRKSRAGKPWIKIKNETAEYGGKPYVILKAEQTDFVDAHGNISFNLEIQPHDGAQDWTEGSNKAAEATKQPAEATRPEVGNGIQETREHLMQAANLLVLCIRMAEKVVAPHQPVVAQTSEQFQSDVAKLFIEASSRRTHDGVNWWSYVDRMPITPLK
jgi:hypothetical protein